MPSLYYLTTKTKEEAEKIVLCLLEKRLVAGANIFPLESRYWWQENKKEIICRENEYAVFMQALADNFSKIEQIVKAMHSYEVPCIVAVKIDKGNKDFLDWIHYYSMK